MKKDLLLLTLVLMLFYPVTGFSQSLIAEYNFDGNFNDLLGGSVLSSFGPENDGYNHNNLSSGFSTDESGAYWYWESDLMRGGGLWVDVNSEISQNYSVGVRFSFEITESGYRKIIDYKDLTSDNGFYFYGGGYLNFYPNNTLGASLTHDNQVVDIITTRRASDNQFIAYIVVDNVLINELDISDVSGNAIPQVVNGKPRFRFFHDENVTSSEATPGGKVYSIKIWDGPITDIAGAMNNSWTGSSDSDWNNSLNWSKNIVPVASEDVDVPNVVTSPVVKSGESASCKNLIINNNANLTLQSGSSLITTGSVGGEVTIQRYITGSSDLTMNKYHLVSIPLATSNNSLSSLFLGSYLYGYNAASNSWSGFGNSTNTELDETTGYMVYCPNAGTTYNFTGEINTGTFTPTVTYEGNSGGNNFALVPNPYPSNIDWNSVSGWTRTNIGSSIWIYNNGNYAVWDGTNSINGGSRYISSGQAFFVQTTASSPVLIMDNNVRTHTNSDFLKSTVQIDNQLRIRATANEMTDEILVGFGDNFSDQYSANEDALKFYGATDAPQLYSQNGDYKLSINNLSNLTGTTTVPLEFESDYSGEVTFSFSQIENFTNNKSISFEDKITGEIISVRQQPVYLFEHQPGNAVNRFVLHFGSSTSINEPHSGNSGLWFSGNTLYISFPELAGEVATVELYNLAGQMIFCKQLTLNAINKIQYGTSGIVIARLITSNKVFTSRFIPKL